ncbi:MAG: zf-HC2 domain-containing protein [Thermoanaerobaculia bacterium]|nr:zf-HC2 domain-containing protein [Thermoanaerobaculia bacterium]
MAGRVRRDGNAPSRQTVAGYGQAPRSGRGRVTDGKRIMACNRCRRLLFLWVDREREALPVGPLAEHLENCPECRSQAIRVERLVLTIRSRCHREAAPGHLAVRIRALLGLD